MARDIPPLNTSCLPAFLPPTEKVPIVHSHEVCKKSLSAQVNKAMGPDNIPLRIKKESAFKPVRLIFSVSLFSGEVLTLREGLQHHTHPEGDTIPMRDRQTAHLPNLYLAQSLGRLRDLLDRRERW